MSAPTVVRGPAELNGTARPASSVVAPRVRTGRPRPPAAAVTLSLLLILGCGAAAGAAVLGSDPTTPVVVAARELPAGTVIGREDLRAADLGGSGITAIRASDAGSLLGRTTVGPVPAGTLIVPRMVAEQPAPVAGQIAVGLALVPGQLPAGSLLTPGRQVQLYQLPPKDSGGGSAEADGGGAAPVRVLVDRALVLSVTTTSGGGTLVDVSVTSKQAPSVAAASASAVIGVGLLPLGAGGG